MSSATRTTPYSGTDHASAAVRRRPLALLAIVSGATAALGPLLVCVAVGVVGWFLSDAGAHGAPRDGMRTGAVVWLMAHGSTVTVQQTLVTMLPLGLTLLCAWATWRMALRLGIALSGHGPDADRIGDGERDWTVPTAATIFGGTYLVISVLVSSVPAAFAGPATARVVGAVLLGTLLVAVPGIAVGSGRAAIWSSHWPAAVTVALAGARRIVLWFAALSLVTVLVSLAAHWGTAANTFSQLHTNTGEAVLQLGLSALLLPNAAAFGAAWLLGPGFAAGSATIVAPTAVVLGPLPLFPLLAALPGGEAQPWGSWVVLVPAVVAAAATVRTQWLYPTMQWDQGALRGAGSGVLAAVVVTLLTLLASGSVGPGRMQEFGPHGLDVLTHGLVAFGVSGLLAGVTMTAWQRRTLSGHVS